MASPMTTKEFMLSLAQHWRKSISNKIGIVCESIYTGKPTCYFRYPKLHDDHPNNPRLQIIGTLSLDGTKLKMRVNEYPNYMLPKTRWQHDLDLADPDDEFSLDVTECKDCAPSAHLANPLDDADEWIAVLYYKDEETKLLRPGDAIASGMYIVMRTQPRTQSRVYIIDGHLKLRAGVAVFETEMLTGFPSAP